MIINDFHKEPYRFLSNFYPSKISYRGKIYPTVEHAYQAYKAVSEEDHEKLRCASTPSIAKRLGRGVGMRADWDRIKVSVMREFLYLKFSDPVLKAKLLATGDAELIERNWWGDFFWGVCNGKGQNMLGKLLMEIRSDLTERSK